SRARPASGRATRPRTRSSPTRRPRTRRSTADPAGATPALPSVPAPRRPPGTRPAAGAFGGGPPPFHVDPGVAGCQGPLIPPQRRDRRKRGEPPAHAPAHPAAEPCPPAPQRYPGLDTAVTAGKAERGRGARQEAVASRVSTR